MCHSAHRGAGSESECLALSCQSHLLLLPPLRVFVANKQITGALQAFIHPTQLWAFENRAGFMVEPAAYDALPDWVQVGSWGLGWRLSMGSTNGGMSLPLAGMPIFMMLEVALVAIFSVHT